LLGLGLCGPLAYRMAQLADAAPSARPVRLFIYYVPHGLPVEHVEPLSAATDGSFLNESLILDPFVPYADKVTVLRGVSMNDGAENHPAVMAALTGFLEGGQVDSIDLTIAKSLGVTAHVIGAAPYGRLSGFGRDSYLTRHGAWVRPTEDPAQAANDLFANVLAAGEDAPSANDADFRRRALALTEQELEIVHQSVEGLSAERSKLNLHLEAIRHLKASDSGGMSPLLLSCESRPSLPSLAALAGRDVLDPTNFGRVVDAHLEVAAAAMVCGTAQVITMQNMWTNSDINFGFEGGPGVAKPHHDPVSHSNDIGGRAEFAACQRWFYDRLATKMLAILDQPDPADTDPSRTVLDNSLIYICSEIADGFNHNTNATEVWVVDRNRYTYLPAILIGGAGGYLSPGRVVDVSRYHTDLLATLCEAMGAPVARVGEQSVSVIDEVKA